MQAPRNASSKSTRRMASSGNVAAERAFRYSRDETQVRSIVHQDIAHPYAAPSIPGRREWLSGAAATISYGVITVCKDSAATIRRAIDSVFQQALLPRQYVFIDGGSRDSTVSIIEAALAEAEHRGVRTDCTLIRQHNEGITQAWNIGLNSVTADVVCILNSDDWYDPGTIERVVARFMRYPKAEIVLGSGRYLDPSDDAAPRICRPRPFFVLPIAMTVIHPACFVRREVYARVGLFDERYQIAADYDFIYRCRQAGIRFVRAPEVVVNVLRGGFAETHMALGWREVAQVGRRHARLPVLSAAGAIARRWLKR